MQYSLWYRKYVFNFQRSTHTHFCSQNYQFQVFQKQQQNKTRIDRKSVPICNLSETGSHLRAYVYFLFRMKGIGNIIELARRRRKGNRDNERLTEKVFTWQRARKLKKGRHFFQQQREKIDRKTIFSFHVCVSEIYNYLN